MDDLSSSGDDLSLSGNDSLLGVDDRLTYQNGVFQQKIRFYLFLKVPNGRFGNTNRASKSPGNKINAGRVPYGN
jgi:hypothetical protein